MLRLSPSSGMTILRGPTPGSAVMRLRAQPGRLQQCGLLGEQRTDFRAQGTRCCRTRVPGDPGAQLPSASPGLANIPAWSGPEGHHHRHEDWLGGVRRPPAHLAGAGPAIDLAVGQLPTTADHPVRPRSSIPEARLARHAYGACNDHHCGTSGRLRATFRSGLGFGRPPLD
jgi:hypothetical protein